jgi:Cu+-exporting ATPase
MQIDPICGMTVDANNAAGSSVYNGQTYYFCSPGCKKSFDRQPERYLSQAAPEQRPGCC